MGPDMYLSGQRHFLERGPVEAEEFRKTSETYELGYWRKHPNLHGYIVRAFADGRDECQEIFLEEDYLTDIIRAIQEGELPRTEGCFFGKSEGTKEEAERDMTILEKALAWVFVLRSGFLMRLQSLSYTND